jgi:hypothetical protein
LYDELVPLYVNEYDELVSGPENRGGVTCRVANSIGTLMFVIRPANADTDATPLDSLAERVVRYISTLLVPSTPNDLNGAEKRLLSLGSDVMLTVSFGAPASVFCAWNVYNGCKLASTRKVNVCAVLAAFVVSAKYGIVVKTLNGCLYIRGLIITKG